jgi:hypothetical protein
VDLLINPALVSDVVNSEVAKAMAVCADLGLTPVVEPAGFTDDSIVVAQSRSPGTTANRGDTVVLWTH